MCPAAREARLRLPGTPSLACPQRAKECSCRFIIGTANWSGFATPQRRPIESLQEDSKLRRHLKRAPRPERALPWMGVQELQRSGFARRVENAVDGTDPRSQRPARDGTGHSG